LVLSKKRYQAPVPETPLADIDPCFRRDLTFKFGETVADDPELVQIFFRIRLSMYIKTFADEKVTIYTNTTKETGILTGFESGKALLANQDGQVNGISLTSICYIKKA
jgi:hypothetical protein